MHSTLATKLKSRITQLEIQSSIVLCVIIAIIAYGFYVSSRSAVTTAGEIASLQKRAERAVGEADLMSARLSFTDIYTNVDKLLGKTKKSVDNSIQNIRLEDSGPNQLLESLGYATIYLFRNDFSYIKDELEKDYVKTRTKLQISIPEKCSLLFSKQLKNPLDRYTIFSFEDKITDYQSNMKNLDYILFSFSGADSTVSGHQKQIFEANKVNISSKIEDIVKDACNSILVSNEYNTFYTAISGIDSKIEAAANETINANGERANGNGSDSHDVIFLLAINKFGPLVIVFFFSSILISIYRYSSKLVSFYYGRYFAIESLDGPVSAETFDKVAMSFSPDNIDFGKMPRSPIELASDVAGKVVEKLEVKKLTKD